ncbi:MAG: hypothetical protein E7214_01565 [Clostridium sp.]|nr:hypothetical protein [Clostridium sp.]
MICFVDYRTTKEELNNIEKHNLNPIIVPKTDKVYDAIDGHVDIQLNVISKKEKLVIVQKDIQHNFLRTLEENDINYILSSSSLNSKYPKDIILNALILKDYFIHNLDFTDNNLLATQISKKKINVKQGYTKCSVLPIANNAFITSDKKIYKALLNIDMDVLLVPPGDILLHTLNYGFIGGVGGLISPNKIGLFGELKNYLYADYVYDFLYKYDVEPIALRKGKLIDRGSLLTL